MYILKCYPARAYLSNTHKNTHIPCTPLLQTQSLYQHSHMHAPHICVCMHACMRACVYIRVPLSLHLNAQSTMYACVYICTQYHHHACNTQV